MQTRNTDEKRVYEKRSSTKKELMDHEFEINRKLKKKYGNDERTKIQARTVILKIKERKAKS